MLSNRAPNLSKCWNHLESLSVSAGVDVASLSVIAGISRLVAFLMPPCLYP